MKTRTIVLIVLALSLLLYAALAWIDDAIAAALVYEDITLDCQAGSATRWSDGVRFEGWRCKVVGSSIHEPEFSGAPVAPVRIADPYPEPIPYP